MLIKKAEILFKVSWVRIIARNICSINMVREYETFVGTLIWQLSLFSYLVLIIFPSPLSQSWRRSTRASAKAICQMTRAWLLKTSSAPAPCAPQTVTLTPPCVKFAAWRRPSRHSRFCTTAPAPSRTSRRSSARTMSAKRPSTLTKWKRSAAQTTSLTTMPTPSCAKPKTPPRIKVRHACINMSALAAIACSNNAMIGWLLIGLYHVPCLLIWE